MNTQDSLLEQLLQTENLAGSQKSLELYRSFFESNTWEDYPIKASLELAWQDYAEKQELIPDLAKTRDRTRRDAVSSFVKNVEWGILPPPETLLLIHDALRRYLNSNGDLSLDEAFFGKPHKQNSSYAMAWGSNHEKMMAISSHIALSKISPSKMTQVQAVELMLTEFHQDLETDPESLLRSWRRWRKASKKWTE